MKTEMNQKKVVTQSPATSVKPQTAKPKSRVFVWLKRITLWLVIGIVALGALGAIYQAVATEMDKRAYPPPGQMVDVGDYRLHLYCTGANVNGSPTVILEQGGGGNTLGWFLVQPEVAKATRVCSYDRAGQGWSDAAPEPRDGESIAKDLHTLLQNAGIPGPYVLAGHSYGGLFVRAYAAYYPEEVVGLVLLDSAHPDEWTRTPEGQAQYQSDSQVYGVARILARLGLLRFGPNPFKVTPSSLPGLSVQQSAEWNALVSTAQFWDATDAESRVILETMVQVRAAPSLGDLPLMVVTAGANTGVDGQWVAYQNELAALSTNSAHIVIDGATHQALWADPQGAQASSVAILKVVEAARSGDPLKP